MKRCIVFRLHLYLNLTKATLLKLFVVRCIKSMNRLYFKSKLFTFDYSDLQGGKTHNIPADCPKELMDS